MTMNPPLWPDEWPPIPARWGPRSVSYNADQVRTKAVIEISAPTGDAFTVAGLVIAKYETGSPGEWHWFDGGRWHLVEEPPVEVRAADSIFDWEWQTPSEVGGYYFLRARSHDPLTDPPIQYIPEDMIE